MQYPLVDLLSITNTAEATLVYPFTYRPRPRYNNISNMHFKDT